MTTRTTSDFKNGAWFVGRMGNDLSCLLGCAVDLRVHGDEDLVI